MSNKRAAGTLISLLFVKLILLRKGTASVLKPALSERESKGAESYPSSQLDQCPVTAYWESRYRYEHYREAWGLLHKSRRALVKRH
jgi:hypothetical protein